MQKYSYQAFLRITLRKFTKKNRFKWYIKHFYLLPQLGLFCNSSRIHSQFLSQMSLRNSTFEYLRLISMHRYLIMKSIIKLWWDQTQLIACEAAHFWILNIEVKLGGRLNNRHLINTIDCKFGDESTNKTATLVFLYELSSFWPPTVNEYNRTLLVANTCILFQGLGKLLNQLCPNFMTQF